MENCKFALFHNFFFFVSNSNSFNINPFLNGKCLAVLEAKSRILWFTNSSRVYIYRRYSQDIFHLRWVNHKIRYTVKISFISDGSITRSGTFVELKASMEDEDDLAVA